MNANSGPSRRLILAQTIALVGGVAVAPEALAAPFGGKSGRFFTRAELRTLAEVSDVMIPATDTPGAKAAKAHEFVDSVMVGWASEASKASVRRAIAAIDERAAAEFGGPFIKLSPARRFEMLEAHDAAMFAAGDAGPAKDYRLLKQLVFRGYYLSEIGATQELKFELVPGPNIRQDLPFSEVGRPWAE